MGTITAVTFGAILYTVVTGDPVVSALNRIIGRALDIKGLTRLVDDVGVVIYLAV